MMDIKSFFSGRTGDKAEMTLSSFFLGFISSKFFILAMTAFALDRILKYIALNLCPCVLGPFFNIVIARNQGIALGMFSGIADANTVFAVTTGIIILVLSYLALVTVKEPVYVVGLSLMVGGALGNLFDRLWYGAVIDIIDFHIGMLWRFPTFNFADVAITAGAIMIISGSFIVESSRKGSKSKVSTKKHSSETSVGKKKVSKKTSSAKKTNKRGSKKK